MIADAFHGLTRKNVHGGGRESPVEEVQAEGREHREKVGGISDDEAERASEEDTVRGIGMGIPTSGNEVWK